MDAARAVVEPRQSAPRGGAPQPHQLAPVEEVDRVGFMPLDAEEARAHLW